MPVALVGLPGAGKSAVGRRLSQRLGVPFVDTDHAIEQKIGCSIRDYFEHEGEESFRDLEEVTIAELAASAQGVVATGGGAVLRESNRTVLRRH
ncbi:MAG: AAA family ATPase, partial [Gammaproteobacteria bacterium]|nr:AAA family ATPase [Gammaproteobacteria bacterium]